MSLAEWMNETGQFKQAELYAKEALTIARSIWPKAQPRIGLILELYARILANQKQLTAAASYAVEAIVIMENSAPNMAPGIGRIGAMSVLIEYHVSRGEIASAIQYLKIVLPLLNTPNLLPSVIARIKKYQAELNVPTPPRIKDPQ